MSLEQQVTALVASANALTGAVNGKIAQIDQKTAENTAKVDTELARILTKLPRIIITKNQVLDTDLSTGLPKGLSVNANVTVTEYMTMSQEAVKPSEQIALLEQMEADMGADLRKYAFWRRPFKIVKISWINSPTWLAFPQAADDSSAVSIPVNTFITLGAFVKVLSGTIDGAWANNNQGGKWTFCNTKLTPSGFGSYMNLHPIPTSATGELLVALPAAITGHIDIAGEWFANVNLAN